MSQYVYVNNKVVPKSEALISIFDRSYLYGEGAFETLRAYNGHVAFSDLHYERLKKNCKSLGIDLPVDKHGFEKAIIKLLNANDIKDAYIRVTVSPVGASFGMEKPKKMSTNLTIFCKSFHGRAKKLYTDGAKIILIQNIPSDHPTMARLKSTNYLYKMMARDEVIRERADEGIFCTQDGKGLEGSATNIFMIKRGEIITPPISDGLLPGITRDLVLHLAETLGLKFYESPVHIEELKMCDEVFLTGSVTEVLPIRELVGLTTKGPIPGPVTSQIMNAYQDLLP